MRSTLCTLMLLLAAATLDAQTVTLQAVMDTDTTGRIARRADTLAVISNSMRKAHMQALVDLNEARGVIAIHEATLKRQQDVIDAASRALGRDSVLLSAFREQIKDYETKVALLEAKIRKLNPLISIEGGVGVNAGGLGAVAGLGIRRLRILGTLQERNSGVFGGLWLPVF